jgi:hypothetical protein
LAENRGLRPRLGGLSRRLCVNPGRISKSESQLVRSTLSLTKTDPPMNDTCDSYESRLVELLTLSLASKPAVGPPDFGMPAAYAEAANIVFPASALEIR